VAECFIAQHEGARARDLSFTPRPLRCPELLISALTTAEFWERFQSAWFCLDYERMPWSVKAEDLLRTQYAPTGAAASAAVDAVRTELRQADHRAGCQRVHSCLRRARQSIIPSPKMIFFEAGHPYDRWLASFCASRVRLPARRGWRRWLQRISRAASRAGSLSGAHAH
jgi:hypothetical protein